MSENIEAHDSAERWKQKYYASLEQIEGRERQWGEVENLLRRCISRLTLVADGADPDLNRQIETLRNALRDGRDSLGLRSIIDVIGEGVMRLDRRKAAARSAASSIPNPPQVLVQLLDELSLPRGMGRKVKALRKRLVDAAANADVSALVHEFAALLREAAELAASGNSAPSSYSASGASATAADEQRSAHAAEGGAGLLTKLFGKRRNAKFDAEATPTAECVASPPGAPSVDLAEILPRLFSKLSVPAPLQARVDALRARAASAVHHDASSLIEETAAVLGEALGAARSAAAAPGNPAAPAAPDAEEGRVALHEALIQLVERLPLPAELSEHAEALKQRLEGGLREEELSEVLESIAALVSEVRARMQHERIETENFLKQLGERLRELDLHMRGAEDMRKEALQNGRRLDAVLDAQAGDMSAALQSASDLDQLKQVIQAHVEALRAHVEEHRRAEEERNTRAEQRVRVLTARLQSLEEEAEQLRARVQKERGQALRDALTGIPNRLAYRERLEQEYLRWRRYQTPLTLMVWDVDKFKFINDTYGHKSGDKALVTIAEMLRVQIRDADFLARYGGEEFVILLPGTQLDAAQAVAEKLRASIETCRFHFRERDVPITISCGMAEFSGDDTPEQVFERADAALYRAKKVGGNQCLTEPERATGVKMG